MEDKNYPTIGEVFDSIQEHYTEKMIRWVPYYQDLIGSFNTSTPADFYPKKVLDLGSGNGNVVATLLTKYPRANYTLLDASEKMLTEAMARFASFKIAIQHGLMQETQFANDTFDLATASFSLHHLTEDHKRAVISSTFEFLRPGGYFCYADLFISKTDHNHPQFLKYWESFVTKSNVEGDWEFLFEHYQTHDHPSNLSTQVKWLQDLNFKKITVVIYEKYWVFISAQK
jgi:tRNA (cmo5U34)-methyltransferase